MKRCCTCGKLRPLAAFARNKSKPDGLALYCRKCKTKYNQNWYRQNKSKHISDVKKNKARYVERNRRYVDTLKNRPCVDCGKRFKPRHMDFDHLPGTTKLASISTLVGGGAALDTLKVELAKCELVCAMCHRDRTQSRLCSLDGEVSLS